jgi:phosphoglycolate phosphatase-like HAD superfamily hydrolase
LDATALSQWHAGPTRDAILDFVTRVTDSQGPDYVPPPQRIAVFDNDGTLWCERPYYIQIAGGLDYFVARATANPALRELQPFKAAVEHDVAFFEHFVAENRVFDLVKMLVEAAAGETQAEFEARATAWFADARHPRFNRLYRQMTFAPMVELLGLLRAADFRIFICTGGGMDLVRLVAEELYAIPREHIIGSNMMLAWEERDAGPTLVRMPAVVMPFNDGPGKPVNIQLHIGRPPIFAAGNSNGDIEMMRFAAASQLPHFNLLVHHDDAEREYAYDSGAESALALCADRDWCIASMARDWRIVFAQD